jgi:membrane associated rhomboid family serine protease
MIIEIIRFSLLILNVLGTWRFILLFLLFALIGLIVFFEMDNVLCGAVLLMSLSVTGFIFGWAWQNAHEKRLVR